MSAVFDGMYETLRIGCGFFASVMTASEPTLLDTRGALSPPARRRMRALLPLAGPGVIDGGYREATPETIRASPLTLEVPAALVHFSAPDAQNFR